MLTSTHLSECYKLANNFFAFVGNGTDTQFRDGFRDWVCIRIFYLFSKWMK